MSDHFSRERRLVKTDEFSSVFRFGSKNKTGHFILYTRKSAFPHARLGVVVAKRFAERSVTRNTVKRICREVFRKKKLRSVDCIVRLSSRLVERRKPAASKNLKREIRGEIEKLFIGLAKKGAGR